MEGYGNKRAVFLLVIMHVRSGFEHTHSETLLIAMLRVKSVENATKVRFSFVPNLDNLRFPVATYMQVPMKVDPVCSTVRSQGSLDFAFG